MSQLEINIYDQILKLFVSKDKYHKWMFTPVLLDNLVVATDSHAAVLFDKSLCSLDYPLYAGETDIREIILPEPNQKFKISVSSLLDFFDKCPLIPEEIIVKTTGRCSACRGSGEVEFEFYHNGETYERESDCPVCDSGGNETIETLKLTGVQVADPSSMMRIGGSVFLFPMIYKVHRVAQILSVDYITLIHQSGPNSANMFMVGDTKVLLMPCVYPPDGKVTSEIQVPAVQTK